MAYVIAEPCIGVKDTGCVDACPVDCNTSYDDGRPGFDEVSQLTLTLSSASTAVPACLCARCPRFLLWMTYLRNGSNSQN